MCHDWMNELRGWTFQQATVREYRYVRTGYYRQSGFDDSELEDEEIIVTAEFCGRLDRVQIEGRKLIVTFKWLAQKVNKFGWRMVDRRRFDFAVDATRESDEFPEELPCERLGLETKIKDKKFHLAFWPEKHLAASDIKQ
jgi:hypothetical protein